MADREDFATEVGQLIKGRSPVGHAHSQIENGSGVTRLNSSGGLQHLVNGSVVTEFSTSGELMRGSVGRILRPDIGKQARFDGVGRFQLFDLEDGVFFQVTPQGKLEVGDIPWERITGAPGADRAEAERQAALTPFYAAMATARTGQAAIAFVGSSTTAQGHYAQRLTDNLTAAYSPGLGGGLVSATGGATLASAHPGPGVTGYNFGYNGTDTRDYLPAATLDALALAQPALIVHGIGSNDMARNLTPTAYENALRAAVSAIDARVTVPHRHLLSAQQTRPGSFAYTPADYTAVNRRVAADIGGVVLDFGPPMDSLDIYGTDPLGLGLGDNLHMNAKGGQILGELISDALNVPARDTAPSGASYDSGPRNVTALATGVTAGTIRLRVKSGWARLDFANVQFDTASPKPFGGGGPLTPWGPVNPESGKGFVTQVNTGTTYRVSVNYAGGVDVYGAPAGTVLNGHAFWPFDRTPPSTPIGDPA